jgi:hypothetical protein
MIIDYLAVVPSLPPGDSRARLFRRTQDVLSRIAGDLRFRVLDTGDGPFMAEALDALAANGTNRSAEPAPPVRLIGSVQLHNRAELAA